MFRSYPNQLNSHNDWKKFVGKPTEVSKPKFGILTFVIVALGFGNVFDGSICWVREKFGRKFDFHDFEIHKGGDGFPSCLHVYTCLKCGKEYTI